MRIAQISPLQERVPPRRYGGTERVVHYLTEELVRRGHEVVLFASGDSQTSAELYPCVPEALRLSGYNGDSTIHDVIQLEQVVAELDRFDILYLHTRLLYTFDAADEHPAQWIVGLTDFA